MHWPLPGEGDGLAADVGEAFAGVDDDGAFGLSTGRAVTVDSGAGAAAGALAGGCERP